MSTRTELLEQRRQERLQNLINKFGDVHIGKHPNGPAYRRRNNETHQQPIEIVQTRPKPSSIKPDKNSNENIRQALESKQEPPKEVKTCQLCDDKKNYFVMMPCCREEVCSDCTERYIEMELTDKASLDFVCPLNCRRVMTDEFIARVSSKKAFETYTKRKMFRNDKNSNFCPKCDKLHTTSGIVTCECGHTYCSRHSNAHSTDMSCQDYERQLNSSRTETLTRNDVNRTCKMCPICKSKVYRDDGCSDMTCTVCHHHFCFDCSNATICPRSCGKHRHIGCKCDDPVYIEHPY